MEIIVIFLVVLGMFNLFGGLIVGDCEGLIMFIIGCLILYGATIMDQRLTTYDVTTEEVTITHLDSTSSN